MDRLEEIKQLIANYRIATEAVIKSLGALILSIHKIHVNEDMLYKLSKEIDIDFVLSKRNSFEYPFELSLEIDDFTLYSIITWEFVKKHKLSKKCPMCGGKA